MPLRLPRSNQIEDKGLQCCTIIRYVQSDRSSPVQTFDLFLELDVISWQIISGDILGISSCTEKMDLENKHASDKLILNVVCGVAQAFAFATKENKQPPVVALCNDDAVLCK